MRASLKCYRIALAAALALAAPSRASSQSATESVTVVRVDGTEVHVSAATLESLPRVKASVSAHGQSRSYEGVDLREVLTAAGAGPIDSLRGPTLRRVISIIASDGYRVVIALSELDATLGAKTVLLANRANGERLAASDGPWRLVVVGDARPARSIRMVTRIEISEIR